MQGGMKFRVKQINFDTNVKVVKDFDHVIEALNFVSTLWDLDTHLYELLLEGFILSKEHDNFVMLTGIWPNGTELIMGSMAVAGQMGSPLPPLMRMIHQVVPHDK